MSEPIKKPVSYDGHNYFFDADGNMIAQMRGWGHLTGTGGLNLSEDQAVKVQDEQAAFIVAAINAYEPGDLVSRRRFYCTCCEIVVDFKQAGADGVCLNCGEAEIISVTISWNREDV